MNRSAPQDAHGENEGRRARRFRAPWPIIGALTATAAVTAAVAVALQPPGHQAAIVPQAAAPSITASAVASGTPAARPVPATAADLRRVADRLVAAPYETRKSLFEYTDIRVWETFTDDAQSTSTSPTVSVRRIRYWTNAGDSGRVHAVDESRGCPAEDERWTNEEASPWGGPLSSDPDAVRRQLLGPPPNKGIDLFGQISELYGSRIVPLVTRRGVLTMLARLPHLRVQRNVTDLAGRSGIAVTDTAPPAIPAPGTPVRKTLIFDPGTGDLLAALATDATSTGAPDYAAVPGTQSSTLGYSLHLTRRYTPNVSTPKPDCVR